MCQALASVLYEGGILSFSFAKRENRLRAVKRLAQACPGSKRSNAKWSPVVSGCVSISCPPKARAKGGLPCKGSQEHTSPKGSVAGGRAHHAP